MESNRFLSECMSICPETMQQKLEPQRVYFMVKRYSVHLKVQPFCPP